MNQMQQSGGRAHWLIITARVGYGARGFVYLLVAGIAIAAAFGLSGSSSEGTRGAIETLRNKPAGAIMLGALAIGLVGYAIWRFVQAVLDADDHGTDGSGLTIRSGLLISALTHLALAFFTASVISGWGIAGAGGGGEEDQAKNTAWLLSLPFGRWITAAIAAGIFGAGIAQIVKGAKAGFEKWLDLKPGTMKIASPICRFGLIARGVVFCLIAIGFGLAAWQYNPNEAKGLGDVLNALRGRPFGQALLAIMAFGLLAFSIYSFLEAASRRVHTHRAFTRGK